MMDELEEAEQELEEVYIEEIVGHNVQGRVLRTPTLDDYDQ